MIQQTLNQLKEMRLSAMASGFEEQTATAQSYGELTFEERFGLIVEKQWLAKKNAAIKRKCHQAQIDQPHADIENISFQYKRSIDKASITRLQQGNWVAHGHNLIITGPTGIGKSYIGSALANHFCRYQQIPVVMLRAHELLGTLLIKERAPVSFNARKFDYLRRSSLLIIDEWMREVITHDQARVLLDFIDERYRKKSCLFLSQIPVELWHERFEDPTLADAVLDRIIHNSLRLPMAGESMRKVMSDIEPLNTQTEKKEA